MATTGDLLTIEEYELLSDMDRPTELVKGRVVRGEFKYPREGEICSNIICVLGNFAEERRLGHLLANTGIITSRDPDTVRGGDIVFYSFDKYPAGPLPDTYLALPPDLVIEVFCHDHRPADILAKVAEYLNAGVQVVCVLDPEKCTVQVYGADDGLQLLHADDELALPKVLGEFRARVSRFFE